VGRVISPLPNPQAGGPPTVGCSLLLIHYIHSYPPYLEAVSSIRNPRTSHTVVTVHTLNIESVKYTKNKMNIKINLGNPMKRADQAVFCIFINLQLTREYRSILVAELLIYLHLYVKPG
jgi:hypothetical protein